ncbi:FAD-dependent monooxygenase [Streptomyces winkii]|uniref:FAD-dependent monooxygenase n=1 Tax=Streptomyces winkii TaxID=3051178 RepID=UPI0028D09D99|nr:FAD-dependent monooxygenase [Streptomyces sp. DSM 40971]
MRIVVAGAGIGGLTAALSLHAEGLGAEVSVIEAARELRPLGVGINLLPHAVRELTELGLGGDLARVGVATARNVYCDQHGNTLFTEPRGLAGGYGHPQYSVHRGRLQMLLLSAVRDRLGPHAVRTGTRLLGFEQDAGTVRVRTPDGTLDAAALIGADGLHSAVRARLHPGPDPLLWSGVRMWRGAAETGPFLDGRTMILARGEAGAELIAYPIGPSLVNWVGLVRAGEPGPLPGDADWNRPGRTGDVLGHFGDWDLRGLDVQRLIRNSGQVLEYPMVDRDPLPSWGEGRVTLLGDAAHPMYPVGANGASQAIVDARVLAAELARDRDLLGGLARYESKRREATTAVVAANREMQRTGDEKSPAALARVTRTYRRDTGADAMCRGR